MSIEEAEKRLIEDFAVFEDWMGKYEYIIDLGKDVPMIDEKYKDENHTIKGCQSKVWLHSEMKDGRIFFTADSDAMITKGLVAMVISVLSGHTPEEIMQSKLEFIDKIGLQEHLSPTRANGLVAMINQIRLDAKAHLIAGR
ncbi:MAG TPA: SufE family protein [Bacteroidia bacterium]|nr:SufE family protein [Bacteroidia bacterium]